MRSTLTPGFLLAMVLVLLPPAEGSNTGPQETRTYGSSSVSIAAQMAEIHRLIDQDEYFQAKHLARRLLTEIDAAGGAETHDAARVINLLVEASLGTRPAYIPGDAGLIDEAERAVSIKETELQPNSPELATSLLHLGALVPQDELERKEELLTRHYTT